MSTVIDDDRDAAPAPEATPPAPKRRPLLLTDSPLGRRLTLPAALVLAIASGLLAVLAFPPYGAWPLAAVSVAGFGAAVHRRAPGGLGAAFGIGFVYGMAFFLPLLAWSSTQVGQWPWLFLCALEALGMGLLGMFLAACSRLVDTRRWTLAPLTGVAWVAEEALRSRQPFGGFPWGNLAFSQAESPTAAAIWLGGAPFLSFLVALSGGLLLAAGFALGRHLQGPQDAPRGAGIRKAAAFTAAAALTALAPLALPVNATAPDGDTVNVAVVQGNVPRLGLSFNEQRRAVLDNHVQATLDLAADVDEGRAERPDLVMWPENASDIDPLANQDAYDLISEAAAAIDTPIVLGGIVHNEDGTRSNMTIVWDPEDGPVYMYSKRHPVPFAEYVPYKGFFSTVAGWIDPRMSEGLDNVAGFEHGQNAGIVEVGDYTLTGLICFEIAFDAETRDSVRDGAQLMAVGTNNATFDTNEAQQQLAMVALRSIEHGRDGLMASTVGVSAFTSHTGEVSQATEFNTAAVIQSDLTLSDRSTPASTVGILPEAVLTGAALVALACAILTNLKHRRSQT
ncbi:apolipoprotein N-acyltransferase [Glycomyces algeriensis]|uniref:Apolipoprotein N-acyltransferase n=1 Tax=Glycomyces algeriensis TaxID=256037 RepID=A0A9W6GBA6_9ACTN|nr:apolipoprotein N-acyltransferase [Glycomyces algeriensis]GLI43750.1 apolipoprotein N-acyltransferase [Glycomyces algeriensis]